MSVSGSGRYSPGYGPPGERPVPVDEASALIAWREAVRGARSVLLEAARILDGGSRDCSDARLGAVLAGLRDLEFQIASART